MNRKYNRLYVGNVSEEANLEQLKELLEKVGKLTLFEIQNGKGFIEFESSQIAQECVQKYDDYKFEGKRLVIENAVKNTYKKPRNDNRFNNKSSYLDREKLSQYKEEGRCFKCHQRGHRSFDCKENDRKISQRQRSRSGDRDRNRTKEYSRKQQQSNQSRSSSNRK